MFFAIGFETTAPSTALTLMRARALGIRNFSVFCNHVTIIPAIRAILDSPDMRLDAFIGPGHVSTVIGCRPYEWIARDEDKPIVVSGFEPLDMLQSIVMILRQLRTGAAEVENQYTRVVPWEGNRAGPAGAWPRCSSCVRTSSGADSASSRSRRCSCATSLRRVGRRAARSTSPACGSPTPRPRSAARCSRASSSRRSASCSARNARPSIRSVR